MFWNFPLTISASLYLPLSFYISLSIYYLSVCQPLDLKKEGGEKEREREREREHILKRVTVAKRDYRTDPLHLGRGSEHLENGGVLRPSPNARGLFYSPALRQLHV